MMQLNTTESIDLGRQVHRAFGSWKKAREAATKTDNGVYRLDKEQLVKAAKRNQSGE
jgi:hypothetical protein